MTYWTSITLFEIKSALILKKDFDSKFVYNNFFLKTKINSCLDKTTDFHGKEVSKVGSNYNCLAVISLDSALKEEGIYYPQLLFKECKYIEKEKSD